MYRHTSKIIKDDPTRRAHTEAGLQASLILSKQTRAIQLFHSSPTPPPTKQEEENNNCPIKELLEQEVLPVSISCKHPAPYIPPPHKINQGVGVPSIN
jgi:hypothetical protein